MSAKKYVITLTEEERQRLEVIARSGRRSVREKKRARILLLADTAREAGAMTDTQIAQVVGCQPLAVHEVRKRACERGAVESTGHTPQQKRKARALDGAQEAQLIAVTCSTPPEGRKRWTLKLLQERLIELEVVENVGIETIRRTLKKTRSSRG